MFFPERIVSIGPADRVLDIGPGSAPFPRADVLLEMKYDSVSAYKLQCGDDGLAQVDPRTVFYDGNGFPFKDKEFDYVICSHVLEHVPDVEKFCGEIVRVGKAGYIEYPLFYYDYVYDIPAHVTGLKRVDDELIYIPKSEVLKEETAPFRRFWYQALSAGHNENVRSLLNELMEGFEWQGNIKVRRARNIGELCHENLAIAPPRLVRRNFLGRSVLGRIYRAVLG